MEINPVAAVTAVLAAATFVLALFTQAAVTEARKARKQEVQHHQENLRPFCVVEFEGAETDRPFGLQFAKVAGLYSGIKEFRIKGRLFNKGLGPAKDVIVYLNDGSSLDGQANWLTHPVLVCGLIAANESVEVHVPIPNNRVTVGEEPASPQLMALIARETYEVVLQYSDIFDNPFRTVHARGLPVPQGPPIEDVFAGRVAEEKKTPPTRADKPTPLFLRGKQPWQTRAGR